MMPEFANPWALYLLLLIIPIIILYLLRPKPRDMHVPSLMFIMHMERRKRFRSFFRRIIRDPLLMLQLAAISLLVFAMANPFYITKEVKDIRQDVVVVLDVSASMQTSGRFAQAKQTALSVVADLGMEDRISIVLAEKIPIVLLKQGSKPEAQTLLEAVKPGATPTGIGGAILLASDLIKDSEVEKRIVVISDFSHYSGIDPLAAQKQAFANGIGVELIRVGDRATNIGIVNVRSGRSSNSCFMDVIVKNYGNIESSVQAKFLLDNSVVASASKTISGGSSDIFQFSAPCTGARHMAITSISSADDLSVDNRAYAVIEEVAEWDVLLIRERDSDEYIRYALESLGGISIDETYPPIYPQSYKGYDTVIFQESEAQNILGGTFSELEKFVREGGNLIVLGFEGLVNVQPEYLGDILPIIPIEVLYAGETPTKVFDHQILRDLDLDEIIINRYIYADEKAGSVTPVRIRGMPLITSWKLGSGRVLYLGISANASWSDFYLKPSFPIFWYDVLRWINQDESLINVYNFKTGEQLPHLSDSLIRVKKPSGEIVEGVDVVLDETGFYDIENLGKTIAASLLDEEESDVNYQIETPSGDIRRGYSRAIVREDVVHQLFWLLALIALCLVVVEWFYYKGRGSI